MFQESLVESTPLLRTRNRWPFFLSVAMQATILTLVITIPLLHPEVLPTQALRHLDFLPSPIKPHVPPPPPQVVHLQAAPETSAPPAPQTQEAQIPTNIAQQFFTDANPVESPRISMTSGNPSTNTNSFAPATAPPTPHVAPAPATSIGPLHISEGVLAGNLITPIRPQYPAIARVTGTQGTVIIQATISTTGTIVNPHVVSGPPLLQGAALEAVRNARYRPYLLNHQPTEVETTFSINFHLGS
jgi:protein TonB